MKLEADYEDAARDLLVGHLGSSGLNPKVGSGGVATGIGRITIDFKVDAIKKTGDAMQMVFWASIDGVPGLRPSRIDLDLLGMGADAHEALKEGVHVLLDSVIPVLQADDDRRVLPSGVASMPVTSMTDNVATSWDLLTGSPGVGGERPDLILAAIDDHALAQGIMDSISGALGEVRPHWFKLFIVRDGDGRLIGDVKLDGVAVGVAASFDSPEWPPGPMVVRQFGLVRPVNRTPDATLIESLRLH